MAAIARKVLLWTGANCSDNKTSRGLSGALCFFHAIVICEGSIMSLQAERGTPYLLNPSWFSFALPDDTLVFGTDLLYPVFALDDGNGERPVL